MFCFTIFIVFLDIFIASFILDGSSVIMAISAASIALSAPSPPIAIPISASASTGASFIPSPTNTSFPFSVFVFINSSTFSTFPSGNSSVYTSSSPSSFPTVSPTSFLSPVSITVFLIPFFFNSCIAIFESSFILSAIRIYPANLLFIATYIIVPISLHFVYSIFFSFISFSFPTNILLSCIFAFTPKPDNSSVLDINFVSISFPYAFFTDNAIGWFE